MKQIRIGYLSTMYHTSHIIKGLRWIETVLKATPQWVLFGTGPSMVEAFRAGSLDIGYIGLPPAMIGIWKGLPLVCIGGGHAEGTVMIGRQEYAALEEDAPVSSALGQFAGKKIGAPSGGSIHDVIARHLIRQSAAGDIEVTNYPWADLIPDAIEDGSIDGAFGTPPLAVLAGSWYGHRVVIPPSRIWPFNPSYGIVVTREMLARSALLEDFLGIHERACNLILHNPDEAARAVADEVRVVDAAFVRKVFAVSPRYCASLPPEYIEATMAFLPALQQSGYIDRDLAVDEVFDLSLISRVHPAPHHYLDPIRG